MEEVIQYLQLKNHYLDKFYSLTQQFIEQTRKNNWANLAHFVDSRERILNIIRFYDHRIAELFQQVDNASEDLNDYQPRVKSLLDGRNDIVKKIVELDLLLISQLEDYKNEIIIDLKQSQQIDQQIEAYSQTPPLRQETPSDN